MSIYFARRQIVAICAARKFKDFHRGSLIAGAFVGVQYWKNGAVVEGEEQRALKFSNLQRGVGFPLCRLLYALRCVLL